MPTTPILSPAEFLAETAGERAALRTALTLLELCAPSAPDAVVQYASGRYHEAAQPVLVAALLAHYESPPPEPKRPRLTAPVRRGLMALAAGQNAGEDVARARQWIADEVAVSGDLVKTAPDLLSTTAPRVETVIDPSWKFPEGKEAA